MFYDCRKSWRELRAERPDPAEPARSLRVVPRTAILAADGWPGAAIDRCSPRRFTCPGQTPAYTSSIAYHATEGRAMDANPYNPLQPMTDPDRFFGRADVFAFFRQHLVGTPHAHALVRSGASGWGRARSCTNSITSSMNATTCIVDLGAPSRERGALLRHADGQIRLALEDAGPAPTACPTGHRRRTSPAPAPSCAHGSAMNTWMSCWCAAHPASRAGAGQCLRCWTPSTGNAPADLLDYLAGLLRSDPA